jgi:hypothetical protein
MRCVSSKWNTYTMCSKMQAVAHSDVFLLSFSQTLSRDVFLVVVEEINFRRVGDVEDHQ